MSIRPYPILPYTDGPETLSTGDMYRSAIFFSTLAWFSWILCVAPLVWHISQRNVAASSLVLWIILVNLPLGINSIIWGHDDVDQWWDGSVWCDINTRIQVGAQVSLGAAVAMILRRLAQVMDTRNMTVAPSRSSTLRRQLVELAWCWGYPVALILFYIPIQSVRYHIWGIEGCNSAYDPVWQALVLNVMWVPITMLVVVYYAGKSIDTQVTAILTTSQCSSLSASTAIAASSPASSQLATPRDRASSASS